MQVVLGTQNRLPQMPDQHVTFAAKDLSYLQKLTEIYLILWTSLFLTEEPWALNP